MNESITTTTPATGPSIHYEVKRPVLDWITGITSLVFYVIGTVASVMLIITLAKVFQTYSALQNFGF